MGMTTASNHSEGNIQFCSIPRGKEGVGWSLPFMVPNRFNQTQNTYKTNDQYTETGYEDDMLPREFRNSTGYSLFVSKNAENRMINW